MDRLKEVASFDASNDELNSETDSDDDEVVVTNVKQSKHLAVADSDDKSKSSDDYSSQKKTHRKAPCKQKSIPVPSKVSFDSELFDSSPERPSWNAPSKDQLFSTTKVSSSTKKTSTKKVLSSSSNKPKKKREEVSHHKTSKKPRMNDVKPLQIRSDSNNDSAKSLLSMNPATENEFDAEERKQKPKIGKKVKEIVS